jgi:hypothetical protein
VHHTQCIIHTNFSASNAWEGGASQNCHALIDYCKDLSVYESTLVDSKDTGVDPINLWPKGESDHKSYMYELIFA